MGVREAGYALAMYKKGDWSLEKALGHAGVASLSELETAAGHPDAGDLDASELGNDGTGGGPGRK